MKKFNMLCAACAALSLGQVAHADQFNNLGASYGISGDQHQGKVEFDKTLTPDFYIGGEGLYNKDRHHDSSHSEGLGLHVGGILGLGDSGSQAYGELGYTSLDNHGHLANRDGNSLDLFHTEIGVTGPLTPSTFYKVYGQKEFNMGSHEIVNNKGALGGEIGYYYLPDVTLNLGVAHQTTHYHGNRSSDSDNVLYVKTQYMF